MNNYFHYEIRFNVFKYDFDKKTRNEKVQFSKSFKSKEPLENRKDVFDELEEYLSYLRINKRLMLDRRNNHIIIQPPFLEKQIRRGKFKSYFDWFHAYKEVQENISIYLIFDNERVAKEILDDDDSREILIHEVASYEIEEQDIVDNLETELSLYSNLGIDASEEIRIVYHYGVDYGESGENEESGAKRTILNTPYTWSSISEYNLLCSRPPIEEPASWDEERKLWLEELERLFEEISTSNKKTIAHSGDNVLNKKHIKIEDNQIGVTYEYLFSYCLDGATEIHLIDPYIRTIHQQENLVAFIALIKNINKDNVDKKISLFLKTYFSDDYKEKSIDFFESLKRILSDSVIDFSYEFDSDIHDRSIETNSGWEIWLGRGLDIYKEYENPIIERQLQDKRKCKACFITYVRKENDKDCP